jgi:hypothetical protein
LNRITLVVGLLSLILGCENNSVKNNYAYLGGEIINPNTDYVVIYQADNVIDTVILDASNRFIYKIDSLIPGLYYFKHNPENQVVLLENKDSIVFRLNTVEFDESLVFTGEGSKKNNYLISLFLENETNNNKLLEYCALKPKSFEAKIDSIRERQLSSLDEFSERANLSDYFRSIAEAKINYNYYANKEIYPFAYFGNREIKNLKTLPSDFYAYRKDIDYNNIDLRSFFQYYRFLETHFNNLALDDYFKKTKDSVFNRNSLEYNLSKLSLIDSLITHKDIKNDFLKYTTVSYIYHSKNNKNTERVLNAFLKRSSCNQTKEKIKNLAKAVMKLENGTSFPEVKVVDYNNKAFNLVSVIKKPTVVYFWSYNVRTHFKDSHKKILELKDKYPEFDFMAVNINNDSNGGWKRSLKQYGFPFKNEYHFVEPEHAIRDLVINKLQKVIIVDGAGIIVDSNANMFDPRFEESLLGILNQ